MVRKLIYALLVVALVALPAGITYADEIIRDGETVSADLNISDDLQIEQGGALNANAHIFNGDAEIGGSISGNLLIVGGDVELLESAEIEGECVLFGGEVRSNATDIDCTTAGDFDLSAPNLAVANRSSNIASAASNLQVNNVFGSIFGSFMFGLLAFVVANVAPRQLNQIGDTITAKPVMSGTVGVLTLFGTLSAVGLLTLLSAALLIVCVGILGIPVVLAMVVLLGAGLLLGWVSVGNIVGEIVADQLHLHQLSMPLTAALGTSLLSITVGVLGLLPVIGFSSTLLWWIVAGIGLGAAALTRLGTRTYPIFAPRQDKVDQVINTLDI